MVKKFISLITTFAVLLAVLGVWHFTPVKVSASSTMNLTGFDFDNDQSGTGWAYFAESSSQGRFLINDSVIVDGVAMDMDKRLIFDIDCQSTSLEVDWQAKLTGTADPLINLTGSGMLSGIFNVRGGSIEATGNNNAISNSSNTINIYNGLISANTGTAIISVSVEDFKMTRGTVKSMSSTDPAMQITGPAQIGTVENTGGGIAIRTTNTNTAVDPLVAEKDAEVEITATPPDGRNFKDWTVNNGGITLSSTTTSTATFTMPNNAVEVTASFEDIPTEPEPKPEPKSDPMPNETTSGSSSIYTITELGANGTWTKGSPFGLTIICNGDLSKFNELKVGGQTVSTDHCTKEAGSTKITVKPEYLETLAIGIHTIEFIYSDRTAQTTFTILAATSPKTGDNRNASLLILIMALSATGVVAVIITRRRMTGLTASSKTSLSRAALSAIFITLVFFPLLSSCSETTSETPPVLSDVTTSLFDQAIDQMSSAWQKEDAKKYMTTEESAAYFLEQIGMLESQISAASDFFSWIDMSAAPIAQNEALLNDLHDHLQIWMLMRSNMIVLHTQEQGDYLYSLVFTAGHDAARGFYLVEYIITSDGMLDIKVCVGGDMPISSGFYPNIADLNNTVLFGLTSTRRYNPLTDKRVPSGFNFIEVEYSDGYVVSHEIPCPGPVLIFLPKAPNGLLSIRILGDDNESLEEYEIK